MLYHFIPNKDLSYKQDKTIELENQVTLHHVQVLSQC